MRFLIDENVQNGVAELLRHHGYEVYLATDEMPRGSDDHQVAATAVNNSLILVTHDKDFRALDKKTSAKAIRRYPNLWRLMFCCNEEDASKRLEKFISVIAAEYEACRGCQASMLFEIHQRRARIIR